MSFTIEKQPFWYTLKCMATYYLKQHRKQVILIGAILASVLAVMFTFCARPMTQEEWDMWVSQRAEQLQADEGGKQPEWPDEGLRDTVNGMAKTIATPPDAEGVNVSMDETNLTIGGSSFPVMQYIKPISKVAAGYATIIAVVLWAVSLGTAFINGSAYQEILIKRFIVLFITLVCIANATKITETICNLGAAMTGQVMDTAIHAEEEYAGYVFGVRDDMEYISEYNKTVTDKEAERAKAAAEAEDKLGLVKLLSGALNDARLAIAYGWTRFWMGASYNTGDPLLALFLLLIPRLAHYVSVMLVYVVTISRGVEIAVLSALSPIPFSLVSDSQLGNGAGARFLKNIGALSIQGAIMVAVMYICGSMMQAGMETVFDGSGVGTLMDKMDMVWKTCIGIPVVEVLLLFRANALAQKVMGLA